MVNIQKEVDDIIEGYKIQENNKDLEKTPLNYMESFILLINIIMKDYSHYPNYSHFLNIENIHDFLINQIKNNSVCKIINKKVSGSGFFCYIPYDNYESRLTVLMTTNGIIGKDDIKVGQKIEIKYANYNKSFFIIINYERKVYNNEKYGISFIEIKQKDSIPNINYLEIDENIDLMDKFKENKTKKIFLLHYPKDNPKLDSGIIFKNEKNKNILEYKCLSQDSSIGGALLSNNYTIIGVHRAQNNNIFDFSFKSFLYEFNKTLINDNNKINVKDDKNLIKKPTYEELNNNIDNFIYKSIEKLENSFRIHNRLLKKPKKIDIIKLEKNENYFNDILCPICKTSAIIENEGLNLNIINCNNCHRISNINYNDIEESNLYPNIQCSSCAGYSLNLTPPENQIYICNCGINMCCLCYKTHNKNHLKIEVKNKNDICNIHGKNFNSYCIDCNINICEDCEKNHFNHEIIKFQILCPKVSYLENIKKSIENQKKY